MTAVFATGGAEAALDESAVHALAVANEPVFITSSTPASIAELAPLAESRLTAQTLSVVGEVARLALLTGSTIIADSAVLVDVLSAVLTDTILLEESLNTALTTECEDAQQEVGCQEDYGHHHDAPHVVEAGGAL